MICPACLGKAIINIGDEHPGRPLIYRRCGTCNGVGSISCCDGPVGSETEIGNNPNERTATGRRRH